MKIDKYWLANCRRNRKNGAKICKVCPFLDQIIKYEQNKINTKGYATI